MKALVVLDMPIQCVSCPLWAITTVGYKVVDICKIDHHIVELYKTGRDEDCPLRPLPQKVEMDLNEYYKGVADGWNDCIDTITGETE